MSTTLIQYGKRINRRGILFTLMLSAFIWSCLPTSAFAERTIRAGNGFTSSNTNPNTYCSVGADWIYVGTSPKIVGNACPVLFGDVYVPKAGTYFIRFYVAVQDNLSIRDYADSSTFYLNTTKTLSDQAANISITTHDKMLDSRFFNTDVTWCPVLADTQGNDYKLGCVP